MVVDLSIFRMGCTMGNSPVISYATQLIAWPSAVIALMILLYVIYYYVPQPPTASEILKKLQKKQTEQLEEEADAAEASKEPAMIAKKVQASSSLPMQGSRSTSRNSSTSSADKGKE